METVERNPGVKSGPDEKVQHFAEVGGFLARSHIMFQLRAGNCIELLLIFEKGRAEYKIMVVVVIIVYHLLYW